MARTVTSETVGIGQILKMGRWYHFRWTDDAGDRQREALKVTDKGAARKKALEALLTDRLYRHLQSMYERARSQSINGTVVLNASVELAPVFPSRTNPSKPLNNIWKSLHLAAAEAGIGHTHMHALRHTYCTHSADAGVPSFVLMEKMGHRRLATTEKYYHSSREQSRKATAQLETRRNTEAAAREAAQ